MKYKDLAERARKAYYEGVSYLVQNTVMSIWCDEGIGWQEIWMTAPYAGLYASCMGIELMAKTESNLKIENLIINAYKNVSCAMNEEIPVKDLNEAGMRDKNINITLKSVKYLSASFSINEKYRNNKVMQQCFHRVESALQNNGSFLPAVNTREESILTSYEVITRLKPYWIKNSKELNKCLKYFESILYEDIKIHSEVDLRDRLLIALNVVSEYAEYYSECVKQLAINLFKKFQHYFGNDKKIENRFHVPGCNYIQDIYSISKPLLIIDTLINFMHKNLLVEDYINKDIPQIIKIINKITENGYFSDNAKYISFGLNYNALIILWKINEFINTNRKFKEREFMIINPVLFQKQDLVTDNNLVVVLMPFRPSWSKSVFNAFKEAVESKGLNIWRSDIEHKDDQIVQTIWEKINQAKFIIADCTGKNPNVFYELGIAHTIGKSVFLCSQKIKDYPFDIHSIRHFDYETHDFPKLKQDLISFMSQKFNI